MPTTRALVHALAFSLLLLSTAAFAAEYSGESSTYLFGKETLTNKHLVPLYEYLSLNASDINGNKDLSFHVAGWLRADLADRGYDEERYASELSYAYLDIGFKEVPSRVRFGRMFVYEGVANEQIDGLHVSIGSAKGVDLALYGGSPSNLYEDGRAGDSIYGGRFSVGPPNYFTLGISYLNEASDGNSFREEAGVDVWAHPLQIADITGLSSYNIRSGGWMEHTYHLALGPFKDRLRLNADYSSVDYKHYFQATTLSVFDRANLDPKESYVMAGGGLEYSFADGFSLGADYKNYAYALSNTAGYYGGTLKYDAERLSAGISAHRMDGGTNELRYYQYRAYAAAKLTKVDLALDIYNARYDRKFNGITNAYALSGSAGYELSGSLRVAADVEYSKNPYFYKDVRGLLKLVYKFGEKG